MRRHPEMTPEDLHKLVFQAIHGGNHLLRDPKTFRNGLRAEWSLLTNSVANHGALQRIHPDGRTARIHLAVCKAMGCDIDDVADVLLGQPMKTADASELDSAWRAVRRLASDRRIPFPVAMLPASPNRRIGHHSQAYGCASYRIVNDLHHPKTREALCRLGLEI